MIKCKILNKEIDESTCVLIVDVCDGCIKEGVLEKEIKDIDNWKEICKQCKYHDN